MNLAWSGLLIGYAFLVVLILSISPALAVELPWASLMTSLLGDSNLTPPKEWLFKRGVYMLNDSLWWLLYFYADTAYEVNILA